MFRLTFSKKQILLNTIQTLVLVLTLTVLFGAMIWFLFGKTFLWISFLLVIFSFILTLQMAPRATLRAYRAIFLPPTQAPQIYEILIQLCQKTSLPHVPQIYVIPNLFFINAFSTGTRSTPVIALSEGLLYQLSPNELRAVLAHEISHIVNGDLPLLALTQVMGRILITSSQVFQLILLLYIPWILTGKLWIPLPILLVFALVPFVYVFIQMSLSRTREFHADLGAIFLTSDPEGLIAALKKIESLNTPHAFFFPQLKKPLHWLRSHPESKERIDRILKMKNKYP